MYTSQTNLMPLVKEGLFMGIKATWYIWAFLLFLFLLAIIFELSELRRIKKSGIKEVDLMSGEDFESFLNHKFKQQGYQVSLIGKSGDYGADLIIEKNERKTVVQAKRWKKNVGVKAVQEIHGAKGYYNADSAMVVTNSYFTKNAKKLARKLGVLLVNRQRLIDLILE